MPFKIRRVTVSLGSSTITVWKRRESALSFSIPLRYSSRVVAPIKCNFPRARAGFKILAASIVPSPEPAPLKRWSSSMKSKMSGFSTASSITPLMRSSNSPRNFVPATMAERSTWKRRLPMRLPGTSFLAIREASPSTIAVFPTPASPIRTGFDLVRRQRTVTVLSISASRPMTVSSSPFLAASVRSVA